MALTKLGSGAYEQVMTAGGSAHTKGAWLELDASIDHNVRWLLIQPFKIYNGGGKKALFDIGTGTGGGETVLVANIPLFNDPAFWESHSGTFLLPVNITSGTRIAARAQCSTASESVTMNATAIEGTGTATAINTYGANTSNSRGTQVDPGGTVDTKGAYVALSASVSADINYLIVIANHTANPDSLSFQRWEIDIATGAASSESVVIADISVAGRIPQRRSSPNIFTFPGLSIPAGTRLATRAQCTTNDATDRLIDVSVIAVTGSNLLG